MSIISSIVQTLSTIVLLCLHVYSIGVHCIIRGTDMSE